MLDTIPADPNFLRPYGAIAAARHDCVEALRTVDRLAAAAPPYSHGSSAPARAKIMALLGDKAEAVRLARQATAEGATTWSLHSIPHFAGLRGFPSFDALVKPEGRDESSLTAQSTDGAWRPRRTVGASRRGLCRCS